MNITDCCDVCDALLTGEELAAGTRWGQQLCDICNQEYCEANGMTTIKGEGRMNKTYVRVPFGNNEVLECDGFAISYNAAPCAGIGFLEGDGGSDETALIVGDCYFILNGDFRQEYAERAEAGLAECIRFFKSKPDLVSSWSTTTEEAKSRLDGVA